MEFPKFKNEINRTGEELLPHRPPFLFVDRLISADETGALGEYTYTEEKNDFFKGHFPGNPLVPGVVQIETMAQVAGAGLIATGFLGDDAGFLFAKVEEAKFRKPVRPGDKITVVAKYLKVRRTVAVIEAQSFVNGELASEGKFTCMLSGAK